MKSAAPKWLGSGLVLVCRRCAEERLPEESAPEVAAAIAAVKLRAWLKERLKADGLWGPIRAVETGCLDVCAPNAVTVAIQRVGEAPLVWALDPRSEREELYSEIVRRLGGGLEANAGAARGKVRETKAPDP